MCGKSTSSVGEPSILKWGRGNIELVSKNVDKETRFSTILTSNRTRHAVEKSEGVRHKMPMFVTQFLHPLAIRV